MKVVILAGGLGSRLSEETLVKPKPAVEVGPYPIIWHIMQLYSRYAFNDFIVCLGYKGYILKEYFSNYILHASNVVVDLRGRAVEYLDSDELPPWRVSLVDTGAETMTGGRLKRVAHLLDPDEPFCMTYGDGLTDVNLEDLVAFHKRSGRDATMTAVRPPGRFGAVDIEDGRVARFTEKPQGDGGYINGGFFVLNPRAVDRIAGDATLWEREPLEGLARDGQLSAFVHDGFWHPMDTLRDKHYLDELWATGRAPWKTWS
ncbi:MAG TPA: glucose-1-phosphate cytidylyltransferase [Caulobacteraceae bacterium]|jgi:glucose-1-phosphate cytidylyltransferase|nr:glucose-1-phosphate cytidylyltransferase [Caulobacteraceae bacterium]